DAMINPTWSPITPSSRHPVIPSPRHPVTPSSRHPVIPPGFAAPVEGRGGALDFLTHRFNRWFEVGEQAELQGCLADEHADAGQDLAPSSPRLLEEHGRFRRVDRVEDHDTWLEEAVVHGAIVDIRVHADGSAIYKQLGLDVVATFPDNMPATDVLGE